MMLVYGQFGAIEQIIENHIDIWAGIPAFAPLAEVLRKDREILAGRLAFLESRKGGLGSPIGDVIRSQILCYALERISAEINWSHFVLFKEAETVQAVLEDSFGIISGLGEIIIPYQNQALKIILKCLFGKRLRSDGFKDIAAFMQLFSRNIPRFKPDQDRIMRYKSVVWLVYLAIELIRNDKCICAKGLDFFIKRFRELLDYTIQGQIIDEDSGRPGIEDGKWEKTLFGWLQGEDRKPFLLKLKRQFNFENVMEHANRYLLAEHRKCIFEEVLAHFS